MLMAETWLTREGGSSAVVISSRARLARNLVGLPFPQRADKTTQRHIFQHIIRAAEQVPSLAKAQVLDLPALSRVERQFLMERHLISHEQAFSPGERGVIIGEGEGLSVMINEEDHLRLQAMEPGLALAGAWQRVARLDQELGKLLEFAYMEEWGFLTACPTNVGTGLRASCLVHLPALVLREELTEVLQGITRAGGGARGLYGEGTKAMGDLFQISNTTTLGLSEPEMVAMLERVVTQVIRREMEERQALMAPALRIQTEDQVYRAWGILTQARAISYEETLQLLSRVRLGRALGLDLPVNTGVLQGLMLATQPAHLQILQGKELKTEERDLIRATLVRQWLGNEKRKKGERRCLTDLRKERNESF
ncbi:MAG: protein arginine kinase [Elusimicrobia bacterium]|nr:protein arginine kinase [Elusimicrobiota bacterium]